MAVFKQTLRNTQYRLVLEVTQQSQSVANNTSTVKYNAYVEKLSGTGYVSGYDHPYNIKINGTTVKSGTFKGYDFNGRTRLELGSGTHTVTHSADGTKSISCSAYFEANQSGAIGTGTASGTLTLSRIPRHSSATLPSSFTLGNAFTVTFNRASSSFYHVVDIKLGSTMVWTDSIKEDSKSITIDRNKVLDLVPNANSTTLSFIYTTRLSDGTVIGSSTRNITCNLNAPSPTIGGITHSDSNSTQFTHFGAYIQSKSRIKLAMTGVSPGRGAKITSYRIDVDGQVLYAASGTTQTISRSGTVPVVAKVTDSRGKTATLTVNLSVLAYKPPAITSLKLHRSDSSGNVDDYGTYAKFSVGYSVTSLGGKNPSSVKIQVGGYDNWRPQSNSAGTHTEILSGFGVNSTYNVNVFVSDYFGSTVSTSIVPTGAVTMMWGRDWVSVGTAESKGSGTLNVRNQIYQNNGIMVSDQHGQRALDVRSTNQTPDWYFSNRSARTLVEFKSRSTLDVPGSGSYVKLITISAYPDSSGGDITQFAVGDDGSIHVRYGKGTSWSDWKEVLDTGNSVAYGETVRHSSPSGFTINSRRHSDGTYEVFGEFSAQATTSSGNIHIPMPFTCKNVTSAFCTPLNPANRMVIGAYNGRNSSEVIFQFYNTDTQKPAGSVSMFFHIYGRY